MNPGSVSDSRIHTTLPYLLDEKEIRALQGLQEQCKKDILELKNFFFNSVHNLSESPLQSLLRPGGGELATDGSVENSMEGAGQTVEPKHGRKL